MQQILQKICFSYVSGSFSNKGIGTALCFFAHKAKFFYCHATAFILNFHISLKTHSEIRTCVSSLGVVDVIFVCQIWVWKKSTERNLEASSLHICLTFISTPKQSLTDLSSHHFRDNMKCNSHIAVRKLRCGAPNVIFLTSNICSKGGAEQRSCNCEEVCLIFQIVFLLLHLAGMKMIERKATEKIKLDKKIFPTKCCFFDGGKVGEVVCFTSFWKFLLRPFLRISVIDCACEFWKEKHTDTRTQKSFFWNKS